MLSLSFHYVFWRPFNKLPIVPTVSYSSIGGVTSVPILGCPPNLLPWPSAGLEGHPKIGTEDDATYTTSE